MPTYSGCIACTRMACVLVTTGYIDRGRPCTEFLLGGFRYLKGGVVGRATWDDEAEGE